MAGHGCVFVCHMAQLLSGMVGYTLKFLCTCEEEGQESSESTDPEVTPENDALPTAPFPKGKTMPLTFSV